MASNIGQLQYISMIYIGCLGTRYDTNPTILYIAHMDTKNIGQYQYRFRDPKSCFKWKENAFQQLISHIYWERF